MTADTQPYEIFRQEVDELGIPVLSDFHEAWRIDDNTIRMLVVDQDGAYHVDPPNEDHSGEDAWEWIAFDSGRQRDQWIEDHFGCAECGATDPPADEPCPSGYDDDDKHRVEDQFRPGLDFWIERYEHGLVRYAPIGESSMIDRQWDVAQGVALVRFKQDHGFTDPLLDVLRIICDEYTSWCNGDVWGIVTYERVQQTYVLNEDDEWQQTDSCFGFLGWDYAQQVVKTGAF